MLLRSVCRNPLATLVGVALTAVLALFAASPAAAQRAPKQPVTPTADPPVKADRDGDKLFDDLETRLAKLGAGDRLGVIVRLTAPATTERVAALERGVGNLAVGRRFTIIDGFAATVTKGQAVALAHRPDVVKVEENSIVRASNGGAQTSFGVTKARADAPGLDGDADGAAETYSGADLVAAVVDTGIDAAHLDLDEGKVLAFKDFVNGRASPYDDNGHGTHVAGTIAGDGDARADAAYRGVAPGAGLVGVKVLDANGSGTMAGVTAAIDWVVQNKGTYGIEAINLSLGASGCSDGTDATSQAVNNAQAAGLLVAVAAGNEGPGTCTIGTPGAAAGALTVGAMADAARKGFAQAEFSSRGPTADGRIKPDVSAPGVDIASAATNTTSGYVAYSGTSMATPFAAGVALLMLDANPALAGPEVKARLVSTALDWGRGGNNRTAGTTGADIDYGAGRLDAYAALAAAGAPIAAPPATPKHELREGSLAGTGSIVDYKLDVADTTFPVAATLVLPSLAAGAASSPDFDLYLYDPAGRLVAAAETVQRQERIGYAPASPGTYTLRVRSYSGSGAYFVDVSAGLATDTVSPTVTAVSPAAGATGVSAGTTVRATFSEAMNAASAQSAFSLVRTSDGAPVAGTFSWSGSTMTFDPSGDLAVGTGYTARIGTGAADVAGNRLAAETAWAFTTAVSVAVAPSATSIVSGSLRAGDASRLRADDDSFFEVNSTTWSTYTSSWYGRFSGVSNALTSLKASYRGKNSRTCTQTVAIFRWTDSVWVQLDSRSVGTTETGITLSPGGTLANYVSGNSGDGDVRLRVRCTTTSGTFYASGDLLGIVFTKP